MAIRPLSLWFGLACLGCQSLVPQEQAAEPSPALAPAPALVLWQKGQDAMRRNQPEEAVKWYEQSLEADPSMTRAHLSMAAAYLEQGDSPGAFPHLAQYVRANPEQLNVRVHLADLKLRLNKVREARKEFERCVAAAQEQAEEGVGHLIHCHARLMEIAEAVDDDYNEHLHRGIGLCLLARQRGLMPDPNDGDLPMESLLCKAAGELTQAHVCKPDEARPNWYLSEVWLSLQQRQTALRCLREAQAGAPFSELTPAEKRSIELRCECLAMDHLTK